MALNWLPYMTYADPFGHYQKAQQAKMQQERQALADQMAQQNQQMRKQEHELKLKQYQDQQRQAPAQRHREAISDVAPYIQRIMQQVPPEQQDQAFQQFKETYLKSAWPELYEKAAPTWQEAVPKWQAFFEQQQGGLETSKINPSDYTPESFQAAYRAGDPTLLRAIPKQPLASVDVTMPPISIDTGKAANVAFADDAKFWDTRARAAVDQNAALVRLEDILGKIDTGPWEETQQNLGKFMQSMGMADTSGEYQSKEEFVARSGDLVRELLNAATGPQTDSDRFFLETITPGLGKSKEANQNLIKYGRSANRISQIFSQEYRAMRRIKDQGEVNDRWDELSRMAQFVPNTLMAQDKQGAIKPIVFVDFYKKGKDKGMKDLDILREWAKAAQDNL